MNNKKNSSKDLVSILLSGLLLTPLACSSESPAATPTGGQDVSSNAPARAGGGLCEAVAAMGSRCADVKPTACDQQLIDTCSDVLKVLNGSLTDAAGSCLSNAECGTSPASCLAQSIAQAQPTDAQRSLAKAYCASCTVAGGDQCEQVFLATDGPMSALAKVVVPIGDDLANAIAESCTGPTCKATFTTCAQGVLAKKLAESLSADAAKCLLRSLAGGADPGSEGGGEGKDDKGTPACQPKTCAQLGKTCGTTDDGCGGGINCGTCPPPACVPKTCAQLGQTCGTHPDGCNGTVNCGVCPGPVCTDRYEPNDSIGTAVDLGTFFDFPKTRAVLEPTLGDGDEDWFRFGVGDYGLGGNPIINVTPPDTSYETTVWFQCDSGGDASYCQAGSADTTHGTGCRANGKVTLTTECSGIHEDGFAVVRVRKTSSDGVCRPYTLEIKVD